MLVGFHVRGSGQDRVAEVGPAVTAGSERSLSDRYQKTLDCSKGCMTLLGCQSLADGYA